MTTFEVDIDDGLVDTLRAMLPPGWTVEDWLALKGEEAIAQTRLDQKRQSIQQDAQQAAQAVRAEAASPDLRTNDDAQQAAQDAADADD